MCVMHRDADVRTPEQAAPAERTITASAATTAKLYGDTGERGRRRHHHHRHRTTAPAAASRGVTYLMYACQQGDVDAVRRILHVQDSESAQEILTRRDRTGKSALHYACCSARESRARAAQTADLCAMAAPELIDGRDEDGFTPLHLAVIAGNVPLVNFLLASNADVRAVDGEQHTVVHWATVCGEVESLRAVLASGGPISTPDVHGGYPLHYAAQMCATLQDKDSELGLSILHTLLSHSQIDVSVRDGDGRQPLLWAASAGSPKAMLALIRAGAPVEASDKDGLTALHCAASRGHTECLDTLLTLCGASVDVIDTNGCTALHYAVTLGHADATALLLAHGANANRQDRKGRTPAHCGCAKGQFETVKQLATHDAKLWLRNARGDLPLHEAAGTGRRDLVRWLLEAKPSAVNARNNDGRCPLHLAAMNDNADMCKILIDHGAAINPILRTSKNVFMTPLDCALQRGFRATAKYLQLQGGLPASKLAAGGGGSTTIQVNIKENITVDVSQSTDEEVEDEAVVKRKKSTAPAVRRKRAERAAKKGQAEVAVMNTEVRVSDRNVNIQQSKSVKLNNGKVKEEEAAQKTSVTVARSKSKNVGDTRKKSTIQTQTTLETSSPMKINENIKEINTLAQSIEAKAKSICQEVSNIEGTIDGHSLTSLEEGAAQTERLVVEAAVHPPPSRATDAVHQQYQEVIKSLKDELDAMKEEIKTLKKVEVHANETKSLSGEEVVGDTLKELKTLLEGRVKEIKETVEDFKSDVKTAISSQGSKVADVAYEDEGQKIDMELIRGLERKVKELERAAEKMQKETIDSHGQSRPVSAKSRSRSNSGRRKAKQEVEMKRPVEDLDQIITESEVLAEQAQKTTEAIQQAVNEIEMQLAGSQPPEISTEITATLKEDHFGEDIMEKVTEVSPETQTQSETLKNDSVIASRVPENQPIELEQPPENEEEAKVAFEVLQTTVLENPQSIDDTAPETEADPETQAFEILAQSVNPEPIPETQEDHIEESKEEEEDKAFEILDPAVVKPSSPSPLPVDDTPISPSEDSQRKRFLKSEKREHHMHLPRDELLESSLDDVNSESSFSSTATKREHKSFTVIEPQTTSIGKNGKPPTANAKKKKLRSRSEEMRKNQENLIRRTKASTAMVQNGSTAAQDASRRRAKSNLESRQSRVPVLPEVNGKYKTKSETNIAGMEEFSERSDEEDEADGVDGAESEEAIRRRVKKRAKSRTSKSAGSDYESSNLIDSGFEPSPRSTRIPKWRNVSDRGVNMTSVTQSIQGNIRRYHLERKIFQHLLELKRLQIRAGQHNETMLVKRAIDAYHRTCAATVGGGRYVAKDFTFKSFERFLYESLRKIQKVTAPEYLRGLPESATENPLFCTQSTNRCLHATHAYTGIPCAAYLPRMDHHTIPKIGYASTRCKPQGFLPDINRSKAVTLELCHGNDKQVISLPTDRLDQNKRYYVTFTVKGEPTNDTPPPENAMAAPTVENAVVDTPTHQHSKSM